MGTQKTYSTSMVKIEAVEPVIFRPLINSMSQTATTRDPAHTVMHLITLARKR